MSMLDGIIKQLIVDLVYYRTVMTRIKKDNDDSENAKQAFEYLYELQRERWQKLGFDLESHEIQNCIKNTEKNLPVICTLNPFYPPVGWTGEENAVKELFSWCVLRNIIEETHSEQKRWWQNPETGEAIQRNIGEMLALVHSEISEALEAYRKDLFDDHLPHRKGIEVELADAVIRIFDMAGGLGLDLASAIFEKRAYNQKRYDHTHEARREQGGKKF